MKIKQRVLEAASVDVRAAMSVALLPLLLPPLASHETYKALTREQHKS